MLRYLGIKSEVASRLFNIAVLFFAALGAGQILLWAIDRGVPLTVHGYYIVYERVRPGDEYKYVVDFTRTKLCHVRIDRWIIDSKQSKHDLETRYQGMPDGGLFRRSHAMARISVPSGAADGPAKSCFQSHWRCNPTQREWALGNIDGPETCLNFIIDSQAPPPYPGPPNRPGKLSMAETWP